MNLDELIIAGFCIMMHRCRGFLLGSGSRAIWANPSLITDNGGVFRARHLLTRCTALEIEKEYIYTHQSWENL